MDHGSSFSAQLHTLICCLLSRVNDKTTTVFQSIQKWQKIIWRRRKTVSRANKTSQASPCDDVHTEETQWKCFRGTCLAFYNTAPTLWNSPSGRSEIHYDLKWPELNESDGPQNCGNLVIIIICVNKLLLFFHRRKRDEN